MDGVYTTRAYSIGKVLTNDKNRYPESDLPNLLKPSRKLHSGDPVPKLTSPWKADWDMGLSENVVCLNPMVSDQFPY